MEGHSKAKGSSQVALEVGSCPVSAGEQDIRETIQRKSFPATHRTSGFAGAVLFTSSPCQQHSKIL